MKKFVSIVLALLMVCAMAVTVCAEEVLYSEDTPFWDAGNWTEYDVTDATFFELLNNEDAYLVITRDTETHISFADGAWEKFCILDSWWSAKYPNATDAECQWIQLGTAGHTSADEASILVDCVYDDGIRVMWPAKAIYDLLEANDALGKGNAHFICNEGAGEGIYKITNISIIIPDVPAEETTAPAEDTTAPAEDTTEPATDTTAPVEETSEPANTGIVLALLPMAVAAAAVVASKRK